MQNLSPIDCLLPDPTSELALVAWDPSVLSQRWSFLLGALSSRRYAASPVRLLLLYLLFASTHLPFEGVVSSGQQTAPALIALAGHAEHGSVGSRTQRASELNYMTLLVAGCCGLIWRGGA